MRKTLLIAWREFSEAVKSKGFIVGIALAPILMFGGIAVTALTEGKVDTATQRFALVDRSGQLGALVKAAADKHNRTEISDKAGKQVRPRYEIESVPPKDNIEAQRLELSKKVRDGQYRAFVEIDRHVMDASGDPNKAAVGYYSERSAMDDSKLWFQGAINEVVRSIRMKKSGITQKVLDAVVKAVNVEGLGLVSVDENTGKVTGGRKRGEAEAFLVPFILMMMMYMMVMFGSMPQIHAVMEEKSQRIAEVLLGSVSPSQLMMGKLLGNLMIAVTTGLVYLALGAVAVQRMGIAEYVPTHLVPWFFAYLILAVAMYGAAAVAVGAAVSDVKEAQSLTFPLILPLIIPMFILMPVIKEPNGVLATVVSFIPPCTPLMMLLRQATPGGIPAWQPWAGMALLMACTLLYIWAAGRIFRIGLLSQGKTPKFGELIRWAVKG